MSLCPIYVLLVSLGAGQTAPQSDTPLFVRHAIHNSVVRFAVERAMKAAVDRLEHPECRRVLSEFHDLSGRTIEDKLDSFGVTLRAYSARITFREGLDKRCREPSKLAFTSIGGQEVFICGPQLWETYRRNPAHVEALIIHELMHTLGLGENPPTSMEITTRVLKRCW
jgi:hypothetical protein